MSTRLIGAAILVKLVQDPAAQLFVALSYGVLVSIRDYYRLRQAVHCPYRISGPCYQKSFRIPKPSSLGGILGESSLDLAGPYFAAAPDLPLALSACRLAQPHYQVLPENTILR